MPDRVVVFVDYQNTYREARRVFCKHEADPHWCGQIHPLLLGQWLTQDSMFDRALHQVRVYRGLPSNKRDGKAYAAARRQIGSWMSSSLISVQDRPLRYPSDWPCGPAREKGVDVALAMDFAVMGLRGEYEVGIMVSLDTDLRPALEFVTDLARERNGMPRAEVAAWTHPDQRNGRLSVPGRRIHCHWMAQAVFDSVRDDTNYTMAT